MRILLTGASSFTGAWFARMLAHEEGEVVAALRGPDQRDASLRGRRLAFIRRSCSVVPRAPFGSPRFLDLLRERGPFDLLCHHGADVGDHKRSDYDVDAAVEANCHNLEPVLEALVAAGGRGLLLTGSVFEADEGEGEAPLRAFNGYGLAKTLTWHRFRYAAERRGLALGKLVVAAPFGPLEKEGFTAGLMRAWLKDEVALVRRPRLVRDHVPVAFLAQAYGQLARLVLTRRGTLRASPSGIALPLQDFAQLLSERMEPRLGRVCRFIAADPPEATDEPLVRRNHEPMPELHDPAAIVAMWDNYARYWLKADRQPSSRLSIIR